MTLLSRLPASKAQSSVKMETRVFPGRYDSLEKISKFVVTAAKAAGLSDHAVYAVELAVDEACSNIIEHAYGGENQGEVECSVNVRQGELTITLKDKGQPFEPKKVPKPSVNVPLRELKLRGVGFFLMNKMMDEVYYRTTPEIGNVLTMIKRSD